MMYGAGTRRDEAPSPKQGHAVKASGECGGHRRASAHAHVMTSHALELDTAEAHEAAAQAHEAVAQMHTEQASAARAAAGKPVGAEPPPGSDMSGKYSGAAKPGK